MDASMNTSIKLKRFRTSRAEWSVVKDEKVTFLTKQKRVEGGTE